MYRWECILRNMQNENLCAVKFFRLYISLGELSSHWNGRPEKDDQGDYYSVWRSGRGKHARQPMLGNGYHYGLATGTCATDVQRIMSEGGVNTDIWKPGSLRGAVATEYIELGVAPVKVMQRGHWIDSMVFQKYYNRAGRYVDWMQIMTRSIEMTMIENQNVQRGDATEDATTDVRAALELLKGRTDICKLLEVDSKDLETAIEKCQTMAVVVVPRYSPDEPRDEGERGEYKAHTTTAIPTTTPSTTTSKSDGDDSSTSSTESSTESESTESESESSERERESNKRKQSRGRLVYNRTAKKEKQRKVTEGLTAKKCIAAVDGDRQLKGIAVTGAKRTVEAQAELKNKLRKTSAPKPHKLVAMEGPNKSRK